MNNEIFIKENFKVDDTHSKVRGFVFAYDENDNLVFAKENMIVKTGRQYIMKNGITPVNIGGSIFNRLSASFISTKNSMVEETDTINDFKFGIPSSGNAEKTDMNNNIDMFDLNMLDLVQFEENVPYYNEIYESDEENNFNLPNRFSGKDVPVEFLNNGNWEKNWILKSDRSILKTIIRNGLEYTWNGTSFGFPEGIPETINVIYNGEDGWTWDGEKLNKEGEESVTPTTLTSIIYNGDDIELEKNVESDMEIRNPKMDIELDDKDYFSYKIDDSNLVIQCLIVFNSTKIIEANSLGLCVRDLTKDTVKVAGKKYYNSAGEEVDTITEGLTYEDILFSRVTFPTYYKSATQRLTFKYYIYF